MNLAVNRLFVFYKSRQKHLHEAICGKHRPDADTQQVQCAIFRLSTQDRAVLGKSIGKGAKDKCHERLHGSGDDGESDAETAKDALSRGSEAVER